MRDDNTRGSGAWAVRALLEPTWARCSCCPPALLGRLREILPSSSEEEEDEVEAGSGLVGGAFGMTV